MGMINHLLKSGYKTERFTVSEDSWGGIVEAWTTKIANLSAHLSNPKGGLTWRVGQDDLAVDGILYCAEGQDILEGDRITDLDGKHWRVLHAPTHKTPVEHIGFTALKLELMR